MPLTDPAMLLLAAAVLIGGYARGFSGFGLSAIVMGIGSLGLPPASLVPIAITLEVAASLGQMPGARHDVAWRPLLLLMAGAAIGNPIGIALLGALPPETVRLILLAVILLASLALVAGVRTAHATGPVALTLLGFVSGTANGLSALGGLPIALGLAAAQFSPAAMRATLIAYFLFTDIFAGAVLWANGLMTGDTLWRVLVLIPVLAVGVWFGARGFAFVTPDQFRRAVLLGLAGIAAFGIARAVGLFA